MEWYHWLLLGWLGGVFTVGFVSSVMVVVAVFEKPKWRQR